MKSLFKRKAEGYPRPIPATWDLTLPATLDPTQVANIQTDIAETAQASPYGWGHTIDFGSFRQEGILGDNYLTVAGTMETKNWLPRRLDGLKVADVGCFSGALTALLAARGAGVVYAIDEVSEHLRQCQIVVRAFELTQVQLINRSLYTLEQEIPAASLDLILLSGVLYHLSDMLVGLYILRQLLKPGGVLLIESNAVDDETHSYANFGQFYAGMWWQPTSRCIRDMCAMVGYSDIETHFYTEGRCVAKAVRNNEQLPFVRGMNYPFDRIHDRHPRPMNPAIITPAQK